MEKAFEQFNEKYDLELKKIINEINKTKAKLVLLQFPDGLKPYATDVVDFLKEKTNAAPLGVHQNSECGCKFLIWFGSCFGACDTPVGLEKINPRIDLVIQFGHNEMMPSF